MFFSVVEDISKVRQPLPNFEAIYILTPEETVSYKIRNLDMCQVKRPTHSVLSICLSKMAYTRNVNMADHSVGVRDESNESEASQALMFCFDSAFPEKSCFVVDLVPLF